MPRMTASLGVREVHLPRRIEKRLVALFALRTESGVYHRMQTVMANWRSIWLVAELLFARCGKSL